MHSHKGKITISLMKKEKYSRIKYFFWYYFARNIKTFILISIC